MPISTNLYAASYQVTGPTTPYTWVDISTSPNTVVLNDDAVSGLINIGFTFNFGGTDYTQVRITSNGMLYFNAAGGNTGSWWNNVAVNNATQTGTYGISNAMMPYWTDLNPANVANRIRYQTLGLAPNRQFVTSFLGVPTYSTSGANTFQVILNENGSFMYNYQSTNTQGGGGNPEGATIGYHVSGADFSQFSLNTASVPNLRTLSWSRIAPILTNLKTVSVLSDPFNNVTNPKHVPDALIQYAVRITNSSLGGVVDNNKIIITDPIPVNTTLFTGALSGSAPYIFTDSTPSSAITCPFVALNNNTDCVDFSNDNGATWTYVPNGSYDTTVTHLRFRPTGIMAGNTGAGNPFFEVKFNVQVK
ncbi:MAG: hypothetical protein HOP21_06305 [Methylotenera sp.]|nr:hypothetical protein [Methylotenera sp.]